MKPIRSFVPLGLLLAFAFALAACQTPGISSYDPATHQKAAEIKAQALALVGKSGEPYAQHQPDVEALGVQIETAYGLAASTPNNGLVAREWAVMKDPERDLYGGFVKRWQASGKISTAFREEMTVQIGEGFDYILCLEAAKKGGGICPVETMQ